MCQRVIFGKVEWGERCETFGLKSSGLSYTFKLTITPFDHMIFLMSLALII